jgi:hypothetical protein
MRRCALFKTKRITANVAYVLGSLLAIGRARRIVQ